MADADVHVVRIYKDRGVWAISDRERGMLREPLVFGMEKLLDRFAADIPRLGHDFRLALSDAHFPECQGALVRQEADAGGHWYRAPEYEMRGWLGDAGLGLYFSEAPMHLYYATLPPT